LKKQGVLPLTFSNPADYEKFQEDDKVSLLNLSALKPASTLEARLKHKDGSSETVELKHSMNAEQIEWFKAGSALNLIKQKG
jgi:aconitate hydratase